MFENELRSSERMMNVLSWIVLIAMLALLAVGGMTLVRSWHDEVTRPFLKLDSLAVKRLGSLRD